MFKKIDYKNFANNEFFELRFCRVLFRITSSPFLLNATVKSYILNYKEPDIAQTILSSLHVDGFNTGENTLREEFDLSCKCRKYFKARLISYS